MLCSDKDSKR